VDTLKQLFKDEEILIEKKAEGSFPAIVCQKKYDGLRAIVMKSDDKIKIFSDSGLWIESQLPSLLSWMKSHSFPADSFILDTEISAWAKGKHLPRERIAGFVHEKKPVPEGQFCANVFDVLFFDGKDIHKLTQRERLDILKKFDFGQSTIGVPDPKLPMNLAPSFFPKTEAELRRDMNKCMRACGSEGCMVKLIDHNSSRYSLSGATSSVLKIKKSAEIHAICLERHPVKTSKDIFNYEIGIRFTSQDRVPEKYQRKLGNKIYHWIGKTYNTKIFAKPGTILTVRWHAMNLYRDPETGEQRIRLYEPNIVEKFIEAKEPDFFQTALRIGQDSNLLVTKEPVKNLDLLYPVPPSDLKNFSPEYRRGDNYDHGIIKMEEIPEGIGPGRFVWFAVDAENKETEDSDANT